MNKTRTNLAGMACALACALPAFSQEPRFAERAPLPRQPVEHTMARAGNPDTIARFAQPSVDRHTAGGYIGGTRLFGNRIFARGDAAPTGPIANGTYGTDSTGLRGLAGRVFLRESNDPSRGADVARSYRTDGPHVPDVVAALPLRKARMERNADLERK